MRVSYEHDAWFPLWSISLTALGLVALLVVPVLARRLLNAGKHGATRVCIAMEVEGKSARLQVLDNGPGFPEGFDPKRNANLGLTLVDTLTSHDLAGKLAFASHGGAQIEVSFPLTSRRGETASKV